jgi:ABC-type uncharacterized transport system substrate-binding protein
VPAVETFGFVVNPNNPNAGADVQEAQTATHTVGRKIVVASAASEQDFDAVFKILSEQRAQAVLMDTDPRISLQRGSSGMSGVMSMKGTP